MVSGGQHGCTVAEPAGRRHPDGTIPPPAQRRLPGLSSIVFPPSLADAQRPSADEAEPPQRSMRNGPSASATQAEEPVRALRKARKSLVEMDRLQQREAASGAALSLEELVKLSREAELGQQAELLSTAGEALPTTPAPSGGTARLSHVERPRSLPPRVPRVCSLRRTRRCSRCRILLPSARRREVVCLEQRAHRGHDRRGAMGCVAHGRG